MSTSNSPYYENIYQAMQHFFGMAGQFYRIGCPKVSLHLPNFVGKIVGAEVRGKDLTVTIKREPNSRTEFVIKVNHVGLKSQDMKFGGPVTFQGDLATLNLGEEISNLTIFLTNLEGKLVDSCSGNFLSTSPQKVRWTTSESNLDELISSGENDRVEFKALVKGPSEARQRLSNEFLETVSSFSNKLGGLIIIGVNEPRLCLQSP